MLAVPECVLPGRNDRSGGSPGPACDRAVCVLFLGYKVGMGTEIERKFLVDGPMSFDGPGRVMRQGYIALDPTDGTEVRLRREEGRNTLGIKRGGGLVRHETEIDIDDAMADGLWALTEGKRLEKSRYLRLERGVKVEVDVYFGPLSGLVVAEVEFETEAEALAFARFDWMGEEIGGNARYRNNVLARLGRVPEEGELGGEKG